LQLLHIAFPTYVPFRQPIVTARLVEERLGCAYMTADKLLKQFTALKIVTETTGGQRYRRFEYLPYLALFEPEGVASAIRVKPY
jgi:hypothetical protein